MATRGENQVQKYDYVAYVYTCSVYTTSVHVHVRVYTI